MAAEQTRLGAADGQAAPSPSECPPGAHDREQIYCRRLGHFLSFAYCRRAEQGEPCPRAPECWWRRPDMLEPLRSRLQAAAGAGLAPPAGRLESILAIVARVRGVEEAEDRGHG